ncbi:MAG: hypothetical protein JWP25_2405, partial [Bradyrhizobium sp.]|nr:hypothetical protein [Bradyrhizobium sp.]
VLVVVVCHHVVQTSDLLVLLIADTDAEQVAQPLALFDDVNVDFDECDAGLRQRGTSRERDRERGPDHESGAPPGEPAMR